jgi:serine/threonine protein kinase/tetratricopeptide (TPR) repeat protein
MPDLTGKMLGKYQILERLGRGGMAEVYRAFQPSMNRFVAIKVMLAHLADEEGFQARFQREAEMVGRLRHPNIVQVMDFDIHEDQYYMVMEYIQGETLKGTLRKRGVLPHAETISIIRKLADGVLHRDVKPANVLFTKNNEPVLTDFGVAKIMGHSQMTASGAIVGTPTYISPEAGRGAVIGNNADVYSLGIVFYEMLSGTVPFDADTPLAIIYKHIAESMPPIAGLPQVLEIILLRMLAKDPADRYQTAAEVSDALSDAQSQLGLSTGTRTGASQTGSSSTSTALNPTNASNTPAISTIASPPSTVAPGLSANDATYTPTIKKNASTTLATKEEKPSTLKNVRKSSVGGTIQVRDKDGNILKEMPVGRSPMPLMVAGLFVVGILAGIGLNATTGWFDKLINPVGVITEPQATQTQLAKLDLTVTATLPTLTATPVLINTAAPIASEVPVTPATSVPTVAPTVVPKPTIIASLPEVQPLQYPDLNTTVRQLVENGALDEALVNVNTALESDADSYELLALKALVLTRYRSDRERLEEGRTLAERAIILNADRPEAYFPLGYYYQHSPFDNPERAADYYTRAIDRGASDYEVFLSRAECYRRMELDSEQVLADLNIAIGLNPNRTNSYIMRGGYRYELGDFAGAEADFAFAHQQAPTSEYYIALLALAYIQQDKRQALFNLYALSLGGFSDYYTAGLSDTNLLGNGAYAARFAGQPQQARDWATLALQQDQQAHRARYVMGLLRADAGDFEGALAELDLLIDVPAYEYDQPFLNRDFGYVLHADRAQLLISLGRFEEAVAALDLAIERTQNEEYLMARARLYQRLGRKDAAATDLRDALRLNNDRRGARLSDEERAAQRQFILRLITQLNNDETLATPEPTPVSDFVASYPDIPTPAPEPEITPLPPLDAAQIARLQPTTQEAAALAEINDLLSQGDSNQALEKTEAYLANNAQSYLLLDAKADVLLFRNAEGDFEVAKAAAESAIALDPSRPQAYENLGYYYQRNGDPYEAERYYTLAVNNGSRDAQVFILRADVRQWAGGFSYAQILADYQQAVISAPDWANAYRELGYFYKEVGNNALGITNIEAALALEPTNWLHDTLATMYIYEGRNADAFNLYNTTIANGELDPIYILEGAFVAYFVDNGDYGDEVEQWLDLGLALEPNAPTGRYLKALIAIDQCDLVGALAYFEAIEATGSNEYASPFFNTNFGYGLFLDKGKLLLRLGRTDEAIASLEKFRDDAYYWPPAHTELAKAYIIAGRTDEARRALSEGLRQNPSYPPEREAIYALLRYLDAPDDTALVNLSCGEIATPTPSLTPTAIKPPQKPRGVILPRAKTFVGDNND